MDLERRVRGDHPLRAIRGIVNAALADVGGVDALYAKAGRDPIPPERLLRALLLQAFYSIRLSANCSSGSTSTCCSAGLSA